MENNSSMATFFTGTIIGSLFGVAGGLVLAKHKLYLKKIEKRKQELLEILVHRNEPELVFIDDDDDNESVCSEMSEASTQTDELMIMYRNNEFRGVEEPKELIVTVVNESELREDVEMNGNVMNEDNNNELREDDETNENDNEDDNENDEGVEGEEGNENDEMNEEPEVPPLSEPVEDTFDNISSDEIEEFEDVPKRSWFFF